MCNTKKSQEHRNNVVRPICTKDFNTGSQVHLIDSQSPCGDYKWLMNCQDRATKFRPLDTTSAADVAVELLKAFLYFAASYKDREFTANMINELSAM
ncbi:hypothetical protein AVEN_270217-1 [Araneus ventricosus]|uniref:Uncharacterized protein n=1 Tax=Araneus ventricosus TaxID=182803 RepID=A0A4Y2FYW7_ARAVE|nr:hypothetical protein AVEN_270217-1 [Araneus ventricosus]